ncbi:Maf family nucleotide pyrophosphatase [Kineosporia sp. A_224]|uniref:Maf family nucleotide pyrophosphatase n=1 Tax=Kineosporia sp. A_224 TaxID=1962180 RepID=UPI000B4ADA31|nr:Maf family nucleotide pyrophosphatase [Kineosporia sp. A_224]
MSTARPDATGPVVVLGSASPARRTTLERAGVDVHVVVSDVDEDAVVAHYGVTDAQDVALVLAKAKAEAVAALDDLPDGAIVLGCDSVLELDGEVHGKPGTAQEATARWRRMRGRSGVLHTGHWLVDVRDDVPAGATDAKGKPVRPGGTLGAVASATVHFANLSDAEIDAYVATGEPLQVAGAFTVDSLGGAYVSGIEGDYHTIVGVSLPLLRELLGELGVAWHDLWRRA